MSEAVNLQPFAPADGLHSTITREEYDQIDRIHFSRLKRMGKSAAHYRANVRRDSPALTIGRAIHLATLEPARYASTVAVWTGKVRNGKVWDAFQEANAGKELLTQSEDAQARAMAAAVHAKPAARKYLAHGTPETSVLWHANGLACKCRLDFDSDLAFVELKSTVDASPEGFGRQSFDLDYAAQNAWYSDGYYFATGIAKPTVVIAVEKQFPYEVVVYRVDHLISRGRRQYLEWLDRLAYCTEHDIWPGYAEEEVDLPLPGWVPVEANDRPGATPGGGLGLQGAGELPANGGRSPTQHFVTDSPAPVSAAHGPPRPGEGQAPEDVFNHKEAGHDSESEVCCAERDDVSGQRRVDHAVAAVRHQHPGGPAVREGDAERQGGDVRGQPAGSGAVQAGQDVLPRLHGNAVGPASRGSATPAAAATPCMLFCGAAALKDPESGGWFCKIHIGVPLSIRLEGKRAFRKEAAR